MIMTGPLTENSLFLSMKYKNREFSDIPFIESMSVEVVAPDTIEILVYEKALAGCVEYMNSYIYFDKDGIVLDSSLEMVEGSLLRFSAIFLKELCCINSCSI